jgi:hypothetical protein
MSSSIPYDPEGFGSNPFADSPSTTPKTYSYNGDEHFGEAHQGDEQSEEHHVDEPHEQQESHHETVEGHETDGDHNEHNGHTEHGEDQSGGFATQQSEYASGSRPVTAIESPNTFQNSPTIGQSTPSDLASLSSKNSKVKKYKLTTKVTAIERQGKKDPIIRFDAYTTLPRFRTTTFRDIRRTHHEFIKFFEHLDGANPECFVPSVPPASTSAGIGTEEDEVKVKTRIQQWLDRVTSNPILARDEEFIYFIEADFGYSPMVKKKPPATGLARKAMKQFQPPPDEVTELHEFRPLIKRVYQLDLDAGVKLEKITKIRRNLGLAINDFGLKAGNIAEIETHDGMINMWRKLSKTLTSLGDLEAVKATIEAAALGDGLGLVANDAYVAKEALTNRHLLMRELLKAQGNTKSKHQVAVRVKGSTKINPLKVDEAIHALEEATHAEEQLTNKVRRVSENMLIEKNVLMQRIEHDLKGYISEYVLRIIDSERRALSTWESIRMDVRAVDASGGLSRLGREATPASKRSTLAQSQGAKGDSWSGDRQRRATDYNDAIFKRDKQIPEEVPDSDVEIGQAQETVVDARNAANLLAGSTF